MDKLGDRDLNLWFSSPNKRKTDLHNFTLFGLFVLKSSNFCIITNKCWIVDIFAIIGIILRYCDYVCFFFIVFLTWVFFTIFNVLSIINNYRHLLSVHIALFTSYYATSSPFDYSPVCLNIFCHVCCDALRHSKFLYD